MRNLVRAVRRGLGGILMGLEKNPIDSGSHGRACQHGGQMAISRGMTATTTRSLDGMGGVENRRKSLLADPVEGAHVGHQIVITEGSASLRETEARATRGLQLPGNRGEIPRGKELPFLHIHSTSGRHRSMSGCLDQIRLAAEEGGDLEQIDEVSSDLGLLGRVDVRRHGNTNGIPGLGKHAASVENPHPSVRRPRRAVGLVIGSLENELHPEVVADRLDGLGGTQERLLSLNHTGPKNEERFFSAETDGSDTEFFSAWSAGGILFPG